MIKPIKVSINILEAYKKSINTAGIVTLTEQLGSQS